ncbi:type II toxin-antitoxin system Phd/YefM family antitoxin [uncultured Thiocystis sp.]|jgi:antitoxin StbD|uniref:type II toxin-antitoxin system Phd/YefM family antitoxin n=1 Tax=uncultured Thiocystis sp. TaxID=1202134 RepID=UPI0025FF9502|nr:type II toxin-antitoxin system Phd/YefM family antitoxin [uncultured Thiocystis sp.]
MKNVLANVAVSVSELKRNYANIIRQADDLPVAVFNRNRPEAYLLPAVYYEQLMTYLEDLEDAALVRERAAGPFIDVSLDDL